MLSKQFLKGNILVFHKSTVGKAMLLRCVFGYKRFTCVDGYLELCLRNTN